MHSHNELLKIIINGNHYIMTFTAEVVLERYPTEGVIHHLAEFAHDECRGISETIFAYDNF